MVVGAQGGMDSAERIYSSLIRDTLELVCRMAGPALAFHAVNAAQQKFSQKVGTMNYTRYDLQIILKDSSKTEKITTLNEIFSEIISYVRDIIGDNIYLYVEKGIESVKTEADKEKVVLPKIAS